MKETDLLSPDDEPIEQGKTEEETLQPVHERLKRSNKLISNPIVLFSYSILQEEKDLDLPSKLACSTEWGIWSHVTADVNIVDSLSSYYRIFSLGLGNGPNENFVT